ncbi:MAG: hypothetical protein A2144_06680 [Chloroflexi bacterium RBG_16_50_9]|nr:MAG: hypothetical protein A2144_06680 [Chloroflexi bacterium RBG_16_50_9]
MARCPNCGRETLRTEDWACQWCGYPLLGRGYKKIDKTFKQLQEERQYGSNSSDTGSKEESEFERDLDEEVDLEPEPEPRPEPRLRFSHRPQPRPGIKAEPEPEEEPELDNEAAPEPETVHESEPAPAPRPVPTPIPRPATPPQPELKMEPAAKPEPEIDPRPVLIKLEAASGEIQVSVDEINSVFQSDKLSANAKLTAKILTVTGIVEKVFVREHLEIRYLVLTGTRRMTVWKVRGTFGKENGSLLGKLAEGQTVAVRGEYDGYGNNIIMKNCAVVI